MLTRRKFLATTACTIAAARLHGHGQSKARVALTIPNDATGPHVPIDFVGLSCEVQQLKDPSFFSGQNSGLIREFKDLSSTGVLRLGGNTSEFGYWKPTPGSPEPEHPQTREVTGEPKAQYYAVTVEAVRNLAEFLEATGWTCVYGIGMGTNAPGTPSLRIIDCFRRWIIGQSRFAQIVIGIAMSGRSGHSEVRKSKPTESIATPSSDMKMPFGQPSLKGAIFHLR